MQEVLDSDIAQAGGYVTLAGSVTLALMEWIAHMSINDVLQGVMAVGGIIFLYYKIANARLDKKLKKEELKRKREENDQ